MKAFLKCKEALIIANVMAETFSYRMIKEEWEHILKICIKRHSNELHKIRTILEIT